jgi:hypothetical protein
MSINEAKSQDRRVIPIVWARKGGVQSGFDIGNHIEKSDGIG